MLSVFMLFISSAAVCQFKNISGIKGIKKVTNSSLRDKTQSFEPFVIKIVNIL